MKIEELEKYQFIENLMAELIDTECHYNLPIETRLRYSIYTEDDQLVAQLQKKIKKNSKWLAKSPYNLGEMITGMLREFNDEYNYQFWKRRFIEEFSNIYINIHPIGSYCKYFLKKYREEMWGIDEADNGFDSKLMEVIDDFSNEFWESVTYYLKPKSRDIQKIINKEKALLQMIEEDINVYKENEYYLFEYEEYRALKDYSVFIKFMFGHVKVFKKVYEIIDCKHILKYTDIMPNSKLEPKLKLKEIALKHIYSNQNISKQNCDKIAEKHGHKSGQKLYQLFNTFSNKNNRIGAESTYTKTNNKLKLLLAVKKHLDHKFINEIDQEINNLKRTISKNFEI